MINETVIRIDWPTAYGGPGWGREQKLGFMTELCESGGPILPQSLTLIAPILISLGEGALLAQVAEDPYNNSLFLRDDSLIVVHGDQETPVGKDGEASVLLTTGFSPLFQLYELRSTLQKITAMLAHWQDEETEEVTDLRIELEALENLYLQDRPMADLQIAIATNKAELLCYQLLFQSLGYYALLDPDPVLSSNEQVPFHDERVHLKEMSMRLGRSEMFQQDLLFEKMLEDS